MSTAVDWTDIALSAVAISVTGATAIVIKKIFRKYRRPNGKKGGIVSLHVALAFSVVTVLALTTRNWFITGLAVFLAYLIAKGRLDENQHYLYQVLIGLTVGIAVPYSIFYLFYQRKEHEPMVEMMPPREEYYDMPPSAMDERFEADTAPELRLD